MIGIFTHQEAIAVIMRAAWPWLLVYTFFDTLQVMGSTVVRCTLNQGKGTVLNFIAYFICGIPISLYFAFKQDKGVSGIWLGPSFAVAFLTLTYNVIIKNVNMKQLIQDIQERTRLENEAKEKLEKER